MRKLMSLVVLATLAFTQNTFAQGACWHKSTLTGRYIKCTMVERTWRERDGLDCQAYEYMTSMVFDRPRDRAPMCDGSAHPPHAWETNDRGVKLQEEPESYRYNDTPLYKGAGGRDGAFYNNNDFNKKGFFNSRN